MRVNVTIPITAGTPVNLAVAAVSGELTDEAHPTPAGPELAGASAPGSGIARLEGASSSGVAVDGV